MVNKMIRYEFKLENGNTHSFEVDQNRNPLDFSNIKERALWTDLEFCQCPNCPLSKKDMPSCPAALDLQNAIIQFRDTRSYDRAEVRVSTPARDYVKQTDVQSGLQSYMGLVMASSACPILNKFRGAAKYHLPFAGLDETLMRNVGFYLLKQHFLLKQGKETDFLLTGLNAVYVAVNEVNLAFQGRLAEAARLDSTLNALVGWACTSSLMKSLDEMLADYERFFVPPKK